MASLGEMKRLIMQPILTPNRTIKKYQRWNATVMANIWGKRNQLDAGQLANIKALYDNAKSNNQYNISSYTYGFSRKTAIGRAGYGRLYAIEKGSLERIEKTLRQSLCSGIYHDIDIVNAQPTILSQLAEKLDTPLSYLKQYVENRDKWIASAMQQYNMTRDEVKEWMIRCMFGSDIPELKALQNELKQLAHELRSIYGDLYDLVAKSKEKNIMGTFLAYVAQTEECRCLCAMDEYFTREGRDVGILAYDGCMILVLQGETHFPEALLRGCEAFIEQSTGYRLTLQVKPMVCSPEFSNVSAKLHRMSDIDDVFMAKKLVATMGENIIHDTDHGIMIFNEDTGLWTADSEHLRKKIMESHLVEETMDGTVNYGGFLYKQDIIMKLLPALIPSTPFCESRIDQTIGLILLKDGIYNMRTREFTKGFHRDLYFAGRINRPFPERNVDLIAKLNKQLFEDPFDKTEHDVGLYQRQLIARGIAGHYEDKVMIWGIGDTNSGKGVQSIALAKCFESYVSTYNPNSFLFNKNSGADEAKKLSWVYPIHNSRISIGNEVRPSGLLDISILKTIVSGGDMIPIRKNFCDEQFKKNRSTLLYFCNDIPKFNAVDNATIQCIKIYEYKLSFVDKPISELETWERKAVDIKQLFDSRDYQDAYFWCIMDAYAPTRPIPPATALKSAEECVPTPNVSFRACLQAAGYQIMIGNEDTFTPFSELKDVLLNDGIATGMSDQAIGRELNKLGLKVDSKRVDGKVIKGRRFIMRPIVDQERPLIKTPLNNKIESDYDHIQHIERSRMSREAEKGTIYLVQPAELVGTERYKIGCSAKNDLERCKKGYKKGTRFINIQECEDPFGVEHEIKTRFNEKFTLVAGKEYFEGKEEDIKKEFADVVYAFTASKSNATIVDGAVADDVYYRYSCIGKCVNPSLPDTNAVFTPPYTNSTAGMYRTYDIDCRNNFNKEEQAIIARCAIKSLEDLLRCDSVSSRDKKRALECYQYVCKRNTIMGLEPFNGNTTVQFGKYLLVIRISADKVVTFTQSCGISSHEDYHVVNIAES